MSVRQIGRFLEQWQMDARDLHRWLILAPLTDKAYFEVIASLEGRPTPRAAPASPARSQAGMPAEGDDAHGQEFFWALRTGGGLGDGGQ